MAAEDPLAEELLAALIAERAYAIYEARGRQDGLDVQDWLQAKREIEVMLGISPEISDDSLIESPDFSEREEAETQGRKTRYSGFPQLAKALLPPCDTAKPNTDRPSMYRKEVR
jgi:hypothetical protein